MTAFSPGIPPPPVSRPTRATRYRLGVGRGPITPARRYALTRSAGRFDRNLSPLSKKERGRNERNHSQHTRHRRRAHLRGAAARRRVRRVRHHRRSGPQGDDTQVALPAGAPWPAGLSRDRGGPRGKWTNANLRAHALEAVKALGEGAAQDEIYFDRFASRSSPTASGDFNREATYKRLKTKLRGTQDNPAFHLEIPPALFAPVVKRLAEADLTRNARVIVEKPFGHDLESARALNR